MHLYLPIAMLQCRTYTQVNVIGGVPWMHLCPENGPVSVLFGLFFTLESRNPTPTFGFSGRAGAPQSLIFL